jgi:hypothetical protein
VSITIVYGTNDLTDILNETAQALESIGGDLDDLRQSADLRAVVLAPQVMAAIKLLCELTAALVTAPENATRRGLHAAAVERLHDLASDAYTLANTLRAQNETTESESTSK